MAYQVLARKWRPRNFPEMVGQAHVLRALTNALEHNRLHHAYLFTGTRGVGKTTIARILAKSLNCLKGVTAYPCGECAACQEIDTGRFVDLIEVDAASRTRVEDTRELLENVQYSPTKGRFKVYLIDEVHMLSTHSFNALLKTLEEPPPHVKFLLATTDPQKLPPTILSRCLQFNLKRVPLDYISQHLEKILKSEGVNYQLPALQLLAKVADGSLRDALSLLDQSLAYGAGQILTEEIQTMLGSLDRKVVIALLENLADHNASALLQTVAQLAEHNPDFSSVLNELLSLLQICALAQVAPSTVEADQSEAASILNLAQRLSPEDLQLFYQIGLLGKRDLPLAPDLRGGFEMLMLRMLAFRPQAYSQPAIPMQPAISVNHRDRESVPPTQPSAPASPPQSTSYSPVSTQNFSEYSSLEKPESAQDEWSVLVSTLPVSGLTKQLAINCAFKKREGPHWYLVLPGNMKSLLTKKDGLEKILQTQMDDQQCIHINLGYAEGETPAVQQKRVRETQEQVFRDSLQGDDFIKETQQNCQAEIRKIIPLRGNEEIDN